MCASSSPRVTVGASRASSSLAASIALKIFDFFGNVQINSLFVLSLTKGKDSHET
jgi:hypothetical protein